MHHTSFKHTAARGALVVGASWPESGLMSRFMVVDSSRRAFNALDAAMNPAPIGGVAIALLALAFNGH